MATKFTENILSRGRLTPGQILATTDDPNRPVLETAPEKKETFASRVISKLPEPIKEFGSFVKEGLFGDPDERIEQEERERRGFRVGLESKIKAGGLLPFLGRTDIEKIEISRDSMIERGVPSERAEEVAIADVQARNALPGTRESERFIKLDLSKEEKSGVRMSRLGQRIGGSLDALSVIPVGTVFNVGKTTLSTSLKATTTTNQALKTLKNAGVPDDIAQNFAPAFAKLTDEGQIAKGVERMEELVRTTKGTDTAISPTIPTITKTDPTIPVPVNKVPAEQVKDLRKAPTGDIAMRTMRDGTKRPAIRESGVFAPKEFELHQGRDISGVLGGRSFNIDDGLIAWDNVTRKNMAKFGNVGPGERLAYQGRQVDSQITDFGVKQADNARNISKRFNLNLNDEVTDIQLTMALHGLKNADIKAKGAKEALKQALKAVDISDNAIEQALKPGFLRKTLGKDSKIVEAIKDGIPDNVNNAVPEFRKHFDSLLDQVNPVRKSLGKSEIARRDNYAPVLQETSFWAKMRPSKQTEIVDNFDYIIPNAKKNPHALSRNAGADDLEWRASKLMERYHESVARDVFDAPFIEQLKAVESVLKGRGYHKTSDLIQRHIREGRVGQPAQLDAFFGITEGTKKRAALNKLNTARTISALSANIVWIGFVQPASAIMTVARAGPINTAKGVFEFVTSPASRKYVNTLPTIQTKRGGMSIGSTGAGDIDQLGSKIVKTRFEKFSDFLNKLADSNEYFLTGASSLAGRAKAKNLKLEGEAVDIFADWMGGATQSRYNRAARPLISNNILLRTTWPFQTYAFELYRYGKTLVGLPGGRALEKTERLNQALLLLGGMYTYDAYLDKTIGRRLATEKIDVGDIPDIPIITDDGKLVVPRVATWIPMAGEAVDGLVSRGQKALGIEDPDRQFPAGQRASGAIIGDLDNFMSAIDGYIRHGNLNPLRKEMVKWGMGFTGVPGATTINRFVDGLIANSQGFQTDRSGKRLFRIEGIDRYLSPFFGPYSTRAGIEFFKEGGSIIEQDARREKRRLQAMPREEAAKELDRIMGENPNLARQINILVQNERNPILAEIRGLNNADKADKIVELFEDIEPAQRKEEYQKLIDAGEINQNVTNKVKDLQTKQEAAARGELPDLTDGEERGDKGIIKTVWLYAQAIGTDPIDAFGKIFGGETIKRIDNGAIIVERLEFEESQGIRQERAKASELKNLKLDHVIPLQLGGSNREDNLVLVSNAEWEAYTPIENLLGDHLRAGTIDRKEAQRLIKGFKEGEIPPEEIIEKFPPTGGGTFERFNGDDESSATFDVQDIFRKLDSE